MLSDEQKNAHDPTRDPPPPRTPGDRGGTPRSRARRWPGPGGGGPPGGLHPFFSRL